MTVGNDLWPAELTDGRAEMGRKGMTWRWRRTTAPHRSVPLWRKETNIESNGESRGPIEAKERVRSLHRIHRLVLPFFCCVLIRLSAKLENVSFSCASRCWHEFSIVIKTSSDFLIVSNLFFLSFAFVLLNLFHFH